MRSRVKRSNVGQSYLTAHKYLRPVADRVLSDQGAYTGRSHLFSVLFQREHVLGTVPAGTCSRYTPFLVVWTGSKKSCSRLEQFQLEHGQTMFSEQIAPLVCLRNEVWTMWNREHVLSGRGLARRPLSAWRVHVKMTSHVVQCIYTISHTAQTEMCADFKSERRGTENISQCSQSECSCTENLFREHFAGVVYREHIWTGPQ